MYKLLSMGLLGLLAVMVIPVNISEYESGIKFYGAATILGQVFDNMSVALLAQACAAAMGPGRM